MLSFKDVYKRLISVILLIFQLPAFACAMNPYLIWMIPPFGVYALLISPWSPFFWFRETRWLTTYNLILPYMNCIGPVLMMLGTGIFIVSCIQLFRRRKKGLVTYGLYSVVRHPQYFGLILATLGFSLMNLRPASLIMWITLVFGYVLLADSEELDLERKYGESFRFYKQRVAFMLPILPPNLVEQIPLKLPKSRLKRYLLLFCIYLLTIILTVNTLYIYLKPPPVFR